MAGVILVGAVLVAVIVNLVFFSRIAFGIIQDVKRGMGNASFFIDDLRSLLASPTARPELEVHLNLGRKDKSKRNNSIQNALIAVSVAGTIFGAVGEAIAIRSALENTDKRVVEQQEK